MEAETKEHLLKLERNLCEAVKRRDRPAAEAILAADFVATGHAGNFVDREKYLDIHFSPEREFAVFDTSKQTILIYEKAAIVMGEIIIENAKMLNKHEPPKRYTAVYLNRAANWQCAAWQETPIQTEEKF